MQALRPLALALILAGAGLSGCAIVIAPEGGSVTYPKPELVADSVETLLSAYASNNPDKVINLLDPTGFVIYGSDLAEKITNQDDLRQLLRDDFTLWQRASFGKVQDLDVRQKGELATAYFHVPFTAAGKPPVMVRFATTWRRVDGQWRLTQSANTVPTTGMSAASLVRASR